MMIIIIISPIFVSLRNSLTAEWTITNNIFFMAQKPPVGQGLHIIGASWLHTPHSVGLLCTSDQPDAQTSTWQHTTLTRDKHPYPRWDSNPESQQASGRRPTP